MSWLELVAVAALGAGQPNADAQLQAAMDRISGHAAVRGSLAAIQAADAATLADQRSLAEVAAPPFSEAERAAVLRRRLQEAGLEDVRIDAVGNVIARRPGSGGASAPTIVLSAHLDTVFPAGTDVTVRERDGRLFGPGIADDARGLAAMLAIVRALEQGGIETVANLLFVGTVGEEGLGDLRGVKALVRDHPQIDGFISIDGADVETITSRATASRRWQITFSGPGGHSSVDFGRPSAIHAMGRAIAAIGELRPPASPRTTFTVGTVRGGTSVNAIAGEAVMEVDIRSDGAAEVAALERQILQGVEQAVAAENRRWASDALRVETRLVGDRPAGAMADDSAIVRTALAAARLVDGPPPRLVASSTDSNVPMAAGIPSVTLRGGGEAGDMHSAGEWYRPTRAWIGVQRAFLTLLGLAGVRGVTEPLLPDRGVPAPAASR